MRGDDTMAIDRTKLAHNTEELKKLIAEHLERAWNGAVLAAAQEE